MFQGLHCFLDWKKYFKTKVLHVTFKWVQGMDWERRHGYILAGNQQFNCIHFFVPNSDIYEFFCPFCKAFSCWESGIISDADAEHRERLLLDQYKEKLVIGNQVVPDPISWWMEKRR